MAIIKHTSIGIVLFSLCTVVNSSALLNETHPEFQNNIPKEPPITEDELKIIRDIHLNGQSTNKNHSRNNNITKSSQSKIRVYQLNRNEQNSTSILNHRANDKQIEEVNKRYKYNPATYPMLPAKIKSIKLVQRINTNILPFRIYSHASQKQEADQYFISNQLNSQLLTAYITRKITLENGNIGSNRSIYDAFINELTYDFGTAPVNSVANAREAEEKYLYLNIRMTMNDRIKFWKYINIARSGDEGVSLPKGLTIADILTSSI